MPPAPTISIISIVKNDTAGLCATFESVQRQGCGDQIEFIVQEGSPSHDPPILLLLEKISNSGGKVFTQVDRGISHAFNLALDQISGKSILFLNAGDTFYEDTTLRACLDFLHTQGNLGSRIFYGDYFNCRLKRILTTDHHKLNETNSINHQSAFIGANLFDRTRYDERLLVGMDYDFWINPSHQDAFTKMNIVVASYHGAGLSAQPRLAGHKLAVQRFLRALHSREILSSKAIVDLVPRMIKCEQRPRIKRICTLAKKLFGIMLIKELILRNSKQSK